MRMLTVLQLRLWLTLLVILGCLEYVSAVSCPLPCRCTWELDSLVANCSWRGLRVYPDFDTIPVEHLDLSGNHFSEFPRQYADIDSLIHLDLSHNNIEELPNEALIGFTSLRSLQLANNSLDGWARIGSGAFKFTRNLKHLSLSGNSLGNAWQLVSPSLTSLELVACGLSVLGGDQLINFLPRLERLVLSQNRLQQMAALPSKSLRVLDMSNCSVQRLSSSFIEALPVLEKLNMSRNTELQFGVGLDDVIVANALRELDVSYCNLDGIDLSGLPLLTNLRIRGNMLRSLDVETFKKNTMLEQLDLSENVIRLLDNDVFRSLSRLANLNLAYNEIARLDRNFVRDNVVLVELNLSHNVLQRLTKIVSNSLRIINMSWCEITAIDSTAISGLSAIQSVDLSHNLISEVPNSMRSETLQKLDLSYCRLSTIRNTTFEGFPELAALRLNGNRLTTPIPVAHFRKNKFLDRIWLGDNPWICECHNPMFIEFFDYITSPPPKIKDRSNLRCAAPSVYYGRQWEIACIDDWVPSARNSSAEKIWSFIMITLMVVGLLILISACMKKVLHRRKQRSNRREYAENVDELRRIRELNNRMLEEESSTTTFNVRESNPPLPSYEDAIRMPKPVRPVKSMVDLSAAQLQKQQIRSQSQQDDEAEHSSEENGLQLDMRQRFHSVDMLSNRAKERTAQYNPYRRTGYVEYNQSGSRFLNNADSRFPAAHFRTQNLQSAEQIGNFQSYENSPYTKRKPKIAEIPPFKPASMCANSIEFLTDPEFEDLSSKPGSPFAKRKPKTPTTMRVDAQVYNLQEQLMVKLDPAVEDYFGSNTKQQTSSSSTIDSEFQELMAPEDTSLRADNPSNVSTTDPEMCLAQGKRKKRKNSVRRVSGNFSAAAAAAEKDTSSSDEDSNADGKGVGERTIQVHKPMRETLF